MDPAALKFLLDEIGRKFDEADARFDRLFGRLQQPARGSTPFPCNGDSGAVPTKALVTSTDPDAPLGSGADSIPTHTSEGPLERADDAQTSSAEEAMAAMGAAADAGDPARLDPYADIATAQALFSDGAVQHLADALIDANALDRPVHNLSETDSDEAEAVHQALAIDAALSDVVIDAPTKCLREFLSTDVNVQASVFAAEGCQQSPVQHASPGTPTLSLHTSSLKSQVHINCRADFYNWNRVKLRYCDGGSFMGDSVYINSSSVLYFSGQRIWDAIVTDLLRKGLARAEKVLLSGCSAGGLATFFHCDGLKQRLGGAVTVKCLSDAGFFLDLNDVSRSNTIRQFFSRLDSLQKNLNTDCLNSTDNAYLFHHILVPPSSDPGGHWSRCKSDPGACSAPQIATLQGLRSGMLASLKQFESKPKAGMFINSCFAHCQSELQDTWFAPNSPLIDNNKIAEVVTIGVFHLCNMSLFASKSIITAVLGSPRTYIVLLCPATNACDGHNVFGQVNQHDLGLLWPLPKGPWPPPKQLKVMHDEVDLRPALWPSFILVEFHTEWCYCMLGASVCAATEMTMGSRSKDSTKELQMPWDPGLQKTNGLIVNLRWVGQIVNLKLGGPYEQVVHVDYTDWVDSKSDAASVNSEMMGCLNASSLQEPWLDSTPVTDVGEVEFTFAERPYTDTVEENLSMQKTNGFSDQGNFSIFVWDPGDRTVQRLGGKPHFKWWGMLAPCQGRSQKNTTGTSRRRHWWLRRSSRVTAATKVSRMGLVSVLG